MKKLVISLFSLMNYNNKLFIHHSLYGFRLPSQIKYPWKKILTSKSVLALGNGRFVESWFYSFTVYCLPLYINGNWDLVFFLNLFIKKKKRYYEGQGRQISKFPIYLKYQNNNQAWKKGQRQKTVEFSNFFVVAAGIKTF